MTEICWNTFHSAPLENISAALTSASARRFRFSFRTLYCTSSVQSARCKPLPKTAASLSVGGPQGRKTGVPCQDSPIADEACRGNEVVLSIGRGHCRRGSDRVTWLARACSHQTPAGMMPPQTWRIVFEFMLFRQRRRDRGMDELYGDQHPVEESRPGQL